MARQEQPRENLLAEAKALVERIAFSIAGRDEEVVVGFRRDSSGSVYLGERAYHFNARGQLRRAYADGLLFKADAGHLVSLRRERTPQAVELLSSPLDEPRERAFLEELRSELARLRTALEERTFRVVGQVPEGMDLVARVRDWLDRLPAPPQVAANPRVG